MSKHLIPTDEQPEWMGWDMIRKAEKRTPSYEGNGRHFHKRKKDEKLIDDEDA